eukprot:499355-Prorocentrum_minimum.AAC.4
MGILDYNCEDAIRATCWTEDSEADLSTPCGGKALEEVPASCAGWGLAGDNRCDGEGPPEDERELGGRGGSTVLPLAPFAMVGFGTYDWGITPAEGGARVPKARQGLYSSFFSSPSY